MLQYVRLSSVIHNNHLFLGVNDIYEKKYKVWLKEVRNNYIIGTRYLPNLLR